jgi:hypothetical protein
MHGNKIALHLRLFYKAVFVALGTRYSTYARGSRKPLARTDLSLHHKSGSGTEAATAAAAHQQQHQQHQQQQLNSNLFCDAPPSIHSREMKFTEHLTRPASAAA